MLSKNYQVALAELKRQATLSTEIVNLDTSTEEGKQRRDELQGEMEASFKAIDPCAREAARIMALVADDEDFTIENLTDRALENALGG